MCVCLCVCVCVGGGVKNGLPFTACYYDLICEQRIKVLFRTIKTALITRPLVPLFLPGRGQEQGQGYRQS